MKFRLLREMIRVMREVEALGLELDMSNWYQEPPKDESLHLCGTAACVCGYAALDAKIREDYQLDVSGGSYSCASAVEDELSKELSQVTPDKDHISGYRLARVLTDTSRYGRKLRAEKVGLPDSLAKMAHLTSEVPTPTEARQFMEALLSYCESLESEVTA